ncbi:hypothetical protein HC248_03385 [Polaromonas vacuolata]|uniref:DUF6701 domain-containing protein n=1 Tax=Polaromonas vacuolata TaxID=37448 RepID=A0A6H2HDV5_9BURK|nr:DUF6701 domain-containing protein [Polaromonas vacuolata]QJC58048.1 hypothetical protein HC248_03385 [Polaromonas vacuolata]
MSRYPSVVVRKPTRLVALLLCLSLLLVGMPVQALDNYFSADATRLPAGCSISSPNNYVCSSLTLAASDTVTFAPTNSPVTLTINGAFDAGASSLINSVNPVANLTISVGAAVSLGASAVANATIVGSAAITVGAQSKVSGSISSGDGAITLGESSNVSGAITTDSGGLTLGASSKSGSLSTNSGGLTIGASSVVSGNVSTGSGAITLGASGQVAGNLTSVSGVITAGTSVVINGNISTDSSAVTTGADSIVNGNGNGNVSSNGGVVTLGASNNISGAVTSGSGAVTVGASSSIGTGLSSQSGVLTVGAGVTFCGKPYVAGAASFDCLERNANQTWDSAARRPLYTRLAGQTFAFDVVALQTDGSLLSNYVTNGSSAKTLSLELVDGTGSTACESRAAVGSPQSLVFNDTDQGRKVSPALGVTSAYASLRCRIRDTTVSPALVSCSSESFAVRPSGFTVTSPDANADASGSSASAAPVIKAGALFGLTANSSALGYNGTPMLDTSKLQAHAGALQVGAFAGSFGTASASTGAAIGTNFRYGEVGYFRLNKGAVVDSSFAATDQAAGRCVAGSIENVIDTSGRIGCIIGSLESPFFGRFIPDHFAVSAGRFANRCSGAACTDVAGPSESRFTYAGEDFSIRSFTLSASNGFAPSSITRNYDGAFARFDPTAAGSFGFAAVNLTDGATPTSATAFANGIAAGQLQLLSSEAQWTAGVGRMNAAFRLNRTAAPAVPYEAFRIGINPLDLDQVGALTGDKSLASQVGTSAVNDRVLIGSSIIRHGRVRLKSSCISELQDLPLSLRAEYWDGQFWRLNADDIGTRVTLSIAPVSTPDISAKTCVLESANLSGRGCAQPVAVAGRSFLQGGLNGTDSQGVAGFAGNFNLWLKSPGAGNSGVVSVTASVPIWLQFAWQSSNLSNPAANANFGSCSPVIYKRENF